MVEIAINKIETRQTSDLSTSTPKSSCCFGRCFVDLTSKAALVIWNCCGAVCAFLNTHKETIGKVFAFAAIAVAATPFLFIAAALIASGPVGAALVIVPASFVLILLAMAASEMEGVMNYGIGHYGR